MSKLRPEAVANYLSGVFLANDVNIKVSFEGRKFNEDVPTGMKSSDIQGAAAYLIVRYVKFKYGISYSEKVPEGILSKIDSDKQQRVIVFAKSHEKMMIQYFGSSVSDKEKKPLFTKATGLRGATAFKFSRLNFGGQNIFLKKIGLGVEFITDKDGNLKKINIHRFNFKHK